MPEVAPVTPPRVEAPAPGVVSVPDPATWARMAGLARSWVQQWAWHQQDSGLVDDCRSAGLEAWCRWGPTHPRLWWEVQNAMQDEISQALYGVTRSQRPRLAYHRPVPTSWAYRMELRDVIRRLWAAAGYRPTSHHQPRHRYKARQAVWLAMIEHGSPNNIPRALHQQYHIGARAIYNGKRWLQQTARELLSS